MFCEGIDDEVLEFVKVVMWIGRGCEDDIWLYCDVKFDVFDCVYYVNFGVCFVNVYDCNVFYLMSF